MARISEKQQVEQPKAKSTKKSAKSKRVFVTPPVNADVKAAFARWLKGEGRGDLVKEYKFNCGYGGLGRAFIKLTGKPWSELKAMRKADKPNKLAKKEVVQKVRKAA